MAARLLFVGDMHLGRGLARLPQGLQGFGLGPRDLGPVAAWRAVVKYACDHGLDAVVLAGDLVEADNARFEAFGPLKEGIDRLAATGIDVCAVAGNHDTEILPRLAAQLDGFHLLGQGGRWSDHVIRRDGVQLVRLVGWSFPDREVRTSPFAAEPGTGTTGAAGSGGMPPSAKACPTLGVLHCDLDAAQSRYAPVRRADFLAEDVAGWYLGHTHKPSLQDGGEPFGYLGSVVGLDPTETGRHGPWLVEVSADGQVRQQQIPLAPVRWEEIELSVAAWRDPTQDLPIALTEALKNLHGRLVDQLGETRAIGCRVVLAGRLQAGRQLTRALAEFTGSLREEFVVPCQQTYLFTDTIEDRHAPALDLVALSSGGDLPAILARDILALQRRDARGNELLAGARQQLSRSVQRTEFATLPAWAASDEAVCDLLIKAGWRAMEELLAQQGEDA